MTVRTRPRHPALAAALSFLFPGLGQAYAGQRELALILGVPIVLLLAGGLLANALLGDRLRNQLFSSSFLVALLVLDLALLGWRIFAIAHAGIAGIGLRRAGAGLLGAIGALLLLTVGMHAYAGWVISSFETALGQVFSGGVSTSHGETREGVPQAPQAPLNRPSYQWDGTDRINFLLLGVDAAPGRIDALTDTILVVSVDPVAQDAVMVSVPRDTGFMPLPDGSVYPDALYPRKINQLATEAERSAELWCPDLAHDPRRCGIRALERSVGLYLGIDIHYYAEVDLAGFARLVDAMGGLELCLPGRLSDPDYVDPMTGARGIALGPGCFNRPGDQALAFARIRSGVIVLDDGTLEMQDDFKRAERQQEVLLAMRDELAGADTLLGLPSLLDAIGRTVSTDFPRARAGDLASLLPLITAPDIERVVLGLPEFVDPPVDPVANYLLIPRREAIRLVAERLFGADGELRGWYVGSDDPPVEELPVDEASTPSP
jgi:LCP family protein required for cell wall assembly